jgi:hypothetical protein
MKLITASPNITSLDSQIIADLCEGKIYVDVTPSTYIGSGVLNVLGASVKVLNPQNVVVKDYPTSGYDIEGGSPPMSGEVEVDVPTMANNYQYGIYTVFVKMTDADGTEYETSKTFSICAPDAEKKTRKYGTLSASLKGICKDGKMYVIVDTPPNYKGHIVESQDNAFTLEYPTSSELDPLETVYTAFNTALFEGVYKLTGTICATYNYGEHVYVKVQYKIKVRKEVFCIIDECCVFTQLSMLHTQIKNDCTDEEKNKTASIVLDALRLLKTAQLAGECGDDPSEYVAELEALLGCKCTCACNEGTPIINNNPVKDFSITGCNVTKETVGLTDIYTIENYEYAVAIDENGGALILTSTTLADCTQTFRLTFDISVVYTQIKNLANQNLTQAEFWASVINKTLTGINPDCLGITQEAWDALTLKLKISAIVAKLCACCGCAGTVEVESVEREGADVILTFTIADAYTADVFLDGQLVSTVLNTGGSVVVRFVDGADGETHTYVIIPRCQNGQMGTPATDDFLWSGCASIEPPSVSSNSVSGVECPYDLTSLVSALPSGITQEWHTANNTSASTLVGDPTSVSSGVYYVFAKDESTGCYSASIKVTLVCDSESACTAPQTLQVTKTLGGFLVQFQSAAFPPPLNSYTVKRRLFADPDIDGSYTTIGTPTWNAGTLRWEIVDATAVDNVLYVYKAISNCGDDSTPFITYNFANILCPEILFTSNPESIGYSFVPSIGSGVDKYEVRIYDASGVTLIDTDTYVPAFSNPTEGEFIYLTADTIYKIRLRVFIGDYYKDCTFQSVATSEAVDTTNFTVTNNVEGGEIDAVNPPFYAITEGDFPVPFGFAAEGIQGGGTVAVAVDINSTGAPDAGNVKLFKNGVMIECIAVPQGVNDTYTFASHAFLASDDVEIIYSLGSC